MCGCAEFDVPGEGCEFGVGDAEGGVCAACGAAVGAAVVAGRFSHGRFR